MDITRIGLDIAKNIFHIHGADRKGQPVVRKKLSRAQMIPWFKKLSPCLIGMEACATAHYWARELQKLGHTVKLIPAQHVKPYLLNNKNDANDAAAICEAMVRPGIHCVPVKTPQQQADQAGMRVRERLIRSRTALVNEIRGLLAEQGIIIAVSIRQLRNALPVILEQYQGILPDSFLVVLSELAQELRDTDERIAVYDRQIMQAAKHDERISRLCEIEGIGPISASMLVAAVGDATQFETGRDMAAWAGLAPRQHSSGGKQRLGGISKRGNTSLRTALIHGARSFLRWAPHRTDRRSRWAVSLAARSHPNVAAVAIANKNMRIAWAILTRGEDYAGAQKRS